LGNFSVRVLAGAWGDGRAGILAAQMVLEGRKIKPFAGPSKAQAIDIQAIDIQAIDAQDSPSLVW
jgi:hypothetical protein